MNVAPFISELLFEHECVVIPGFGGFIVNDRSATINRITHQFSPPFRKIMFNIHLSANDGLLMNYIANAKSIPYADAKQIVNDFAKHCLEELKEGNKISFEKIGKLYKNSDGHIVFEQNEKLNYNSEAFGLDSFYSPPIERQSDKERLQGIVEPLITGKLKPKDRKPIIQKEETVKTRRYVGVVILVLFILLMSIGGGFTVKDHATAYWQNYAMLIPVFTIDNVQIDEGVDNSAIRKEIPINSEVQIEEHTLSKEESESFTHIVAELGIYKEIVNPINENASETKSVKVEVSELPKEDRQIPEIKPQSKPYLIIAGSFSMEANAVKLVKKLHQLGLDAVIADTTKSGMFRVAHSSFATMNEAKEKLYALRNEQYPDAWILKKK